MPSEITAADLIASSWLTNKIYTEVEKQGFPGYMCYSFMQTARSTKSVILSRLPGGVGLDLISKGYDLKGFHIKAKSCNWGPMAGFICQLPVFNKLGISKVADNAKEVLHYLEHLAHFSGSKKSIEEATAHRDKQIAKILLNDPDRKQKIDSYNTKCNEIVVEILTAAKKQEEIKGEWSGENAIQTKYPFIELKREFNTDNLTDIRGVRHVVHINERTIYGVAENVTDESGDTPNRPTVITEFLLLRDNPDPKLWSIYHGRIKYKDSDDPAVPFDKDFAGKTLKDKFDSEFVEKKEVLLGKIFGFEKEKRLEFENRELLDKFTYSVGQATIFAPPVSSNVFYAVRGFVNPYPPFKLPEPPKTGEAPPTVQDEYYKNAVSGDYDLFAI
ncbi:MAG TPA: anthrax toxin-like adenylyl cyclase domain-containing protein, partial [Mucilaginibacter sp.]|nr:anthrax toxin-like adenylyl cyclase domain-containing protein [Mucilaginibacter sp.]